MDKDLGKLLLEKVGGGGSNVFCGPNKKPHFCTSVVSQNLVISNIVCVTVQTEAELHMATRQNIFMYCRLPLGAVSVRTETRHMCLRTLTISAE